MEPTTSMSKDQLTGAYTHDAFQECLPQAVEQAEQQNSGFAVVQVDIDHFEDINNTHGHAIGDEVLKTIAQTLIQGIPATGKVFRHGGDEFAMLLPGVEKEQAFLLFEGLRQAMYKDHPLTAQGTSAAVKLSISAGIASYPDDGHVWQDVLRKAKDAIYRAKVTGRNKVCLAREERMITKTSHYTQGQLERLSALAKKEGIGEAVLLREALDDLLRKYDV
jgi:diguanylate cyclase (GGDEF)-like protein